MNNLDIFDIAALALNARTRKFGQTRNFSEENVSRLVQKLARYTKCESATEFVESYKNLENIIKFVVNNIDKAIEEEQIGKTNINVHDIINISGDVASEFGRTKQMYYTKDENICIVMSFIAAGTINPELQESASEVMECLDITLMFIESSGKIEICRPFEGYQTAYWDGRYQVLKAAVENDIELFNNENFTIIAYPSSISDVHALQTIINVFPLIQT